MLRTLLPDVVTLPQHFKNHGYITHPLHKVFDGRTVDQGHDAASWTVPYGPWELRAGEKPATGGYQDPATKARLAEALKQGKPASGPATEACDISDNAYHDGGVAHTAAKRMREFSQKEQPFFLAVGFVKPHLPFIAPKKYWDLYDRAALPLAPFQQLPQGSPHKLAFYSNSGELRAYSDIPTVGPIPEAAATRSSSTATPPVFRISMRRSVCSCKRWRNAAWRTTPSSASGATTAGISASTVIGESSPTTRMPPARRS
jgi:hypothetical protein